MNTSKFIVLEGIDGSGTTTQARLLSQRLNQAGCQVHVTCEPTDEPIGRVIRTILRGSYPAHNDTLAYLFAADRHDHLYHPQKGVLHHLNNGSWVVCDRYLFSSLAYQSLSCGMELVSQLNNNFPLPGITFFLDLSHEVSMKRLEGRDTQREVFEHAEFQQQVSQRYREVFEQYRDRTLVHTLDAALPQQLLHEEIWKHVLQRISMASP